MKGSMTIQIVIIFKFNIHHSQSLTHSQMFTVTMDDIPYSRIRVIYVLRPCAVGFALRNVHDIF